MQASRRFNGKAAFVLPFFLPLAAAHAAVREEALPPVGPWHVDWTQKTCQLRRAFGTEQDYVLVQFERFAPGDGFQLILTGDRFKFLEQGGRLRLSYGSDPLGNTPLYQMGKSTDGKATVFIAGSSLAPQVEDDEHPIAVTPQMEAAATTVNLAWSTRRLVLRTGPLDKAFAALRTCTDDLVKTWGLDPAVQNALLHSATPKNNPAFWIVSSDYPSNALANGKQALVNFRLSVDASGKPTACDVQRSYSGEAFDKRTCDLIMGRAKFEPALDRAGHPVPSYYINSVKWYMP